MAQLGISNAVQNDSAGAGSGFGGGGHGDGIDRFRP